MAKSPFAAKNRSNVLISFDKGLETYNRPEAMDPQAVTIAENTIQQGTGELSAPSWDLTTPAGWDSSGKVYNVGGYLTNSNNTDLVLHGARTQYELPALWAQSGTSGGAPLMPWEQQTQTLVGDLKQAAASNTSAIPISRPQTVINTINNVALHVWILGEGANATAYYATQNLNTNAVSITRQVFFLPFGATLGPQSVHIGVTYNSTVTAARFFILGQNISTNVVTISRCEANFDVASFSTNTVNPGSLVVAEGWSSSTFNKDLYVFANNVLYRFVYTAVAPTTITLPAFVTNYRSLQSTSPYDNTGVLSFLAQTVGSNMTVYTSSNPAGGWVASITFLVGLFTDAHYFHVLVAPVGSRTPVGAYIFGTVSLITTAIAATYVGLYWCIQSHWYADFASGTNAFPGAGVPLLRFQGHGHFYTRPAVPAFNCRVLPADPALYHPFFTTITDTQGFNTTSTPLQQQRDAIIKTYHLRNRAPGSAVGSANIPIAILTGAVATREGVYTNMYPAGGTTLLGSSQLPVVYETTTDYSVLIPTFSVTSALTISPEIATQGLLVPSSFGLNGCIMRNLKDFSTVSAPIQLGRSIIFPGLVAGGFDGRLLKEFGGFTRLPPVGIGTATTGGSIARSLIYYYRVGMSYVDSRGQRHQSPLSYPITIQTGGTTDTNTITLAFFIETGESTLQNVPANSFGTINTARTVDIWRTIGNPGTPDKIESFTWQKAGSFAVNGTTVVTFVDTINDLTLQTRQRLLNEGVNNVVDKFTPPGFLSHAVFQQRLWGLTYENGYNLYVSYPYVDQTNPTGVNFGGKTRVDVPVDVGEVKSIAGLDGALVVFGSGADYSISGSAQQEGEDTPTGLKILGPMPSPGGMISKNSWVRIPDGLLYQSEQGFLLFGRGGGYDFRGKPVRRLTETNLYGRGALVAGQNYVFFPNLTAGAGAEALAYNYLEDRWFTLKSVLGPPGLSPGTAIRNANFSVPQIVTKAPFGYYTLNTSTVEQKTIETPWLQPGGMTGYGEISDMQLLGAWEGPHILRVEQAWDYGEYAPPVEQLILTNPGDYQYRFSPVQSQLRSIRYRITVIPVNQGGIPQINGKTCVLFGIMLEIDVNDALGRLANTRNR